MNSALRTVVYAIGVGSACYSIAMAAWDQLLLLFASVCFGWCFFVWHTERRKAQYGPRFVAKRSAALLDSIVSPARSPIHSDTTVAAGPNQIYRETAVAPGDGQLDSETALPPKRRQIYPQQFAPARNQMHLEPAVAPNRRLAAASARRPSADFEPEPVQSSQPRQIYKFPIHKLAAAQVKQ